MVEMDIRGEDNSRCRTLPNTTLRNQSSSSSAFYSANQSPFISPKSGTSRLSTHVENLESESLTNTRFIPINGNDTSKFENVSSSTGKSHSPLSSYNMGHKSEKIGKLLDLSVPAASYSSNRSRSCDVYIGFHGRKPLLLRFTNWLRAELEVQGLSCFVTDRAKCQNSRKHNTVEKAMDGCTFGVIILTKKSFRNPYTIEEMRFFSSKKNLVPIYFDLGPDDCLVRDITERRGEIWEKYGGELWVHYGGLEKEWKEAVSALARVDEWKLEACDDKWRDCILRAVTLLALRLGRRSVVDRITKWREKVEKEEFPYPRYENFVGRKKEMSELEFMLLGDVCGDAEKDYFELKARPRRKNLTIGWGRTNSIDEKRKDRLSESSSKKRKGKEPVLWKETEKEIEMQNTEFSLQRASSTPKSKSNGKHGRRKRSTRVVYGKGIACVSGESGIGKTELLLEFAYRFHQRYKMVLWIGGESRYIRQNYLNLRSFLEVDVGVDSSAQKGRTKSFEEQEEAAIARVRKELMRNIPFLLIIDNLESEKDWWDHKLVMDLLPRFGGETHVIISTRLSRVMNLEPLKLSYLSGIEAMSLMQGSVKDQSITEIDSLRVIEEKLGRLTLGLAIVGAILSEIPITPSRLLDTVNRMPSKDITWNSTLRRNTFLLQLIEICFSIFDHADRPRSLATRMVLASGWFAPAPAPITVLALAATKIPDKHPRRRLWKNILRALTCNFTLSYARKSEIEASSLLLRFNLARSCTKEGFIQFNELVKLYARKRGIAGASQATVQAIISRGSISISHHSDHIWAACFLLLGFGNDPIVVELKVSELLFLVKDVILPLARKTFLVYSRCSAAMELLRLCTDALETADQVFVTPVEKWVDKSFCWRTIKTTAQLNPRLWQELALARAIVLEVRAKLMVRGGQLDIGDDLIRKAVFIRTSICGEDHPDTVLAKETLGKLTRLLASVQSHNTSL